MYACCLHPLFIPFYCWVAARVLMTYSLFTHLPLKGRLGCFRFGENTNNPLMYELLCEYSFFFFFFFFFFFVFCLFRAAPMAYGVSQARGLIGAAAASLHHSHTRSESPSATYTTAHGNARSLTHWWRPGIEPATSWFLVRINSMRHDGNSWI